MEKEKLRTIYLDKMAAMPAGELQDKSQSIAALFFEKFSLKKEKAVHVFIPIARHNEVNTYLIINRILKDFPHVRLGVPKSDFKKLTITSIEYNSDSKLKVNKLGIPEPQDGAIIEPNEFGIIVMPLLCFDNKGMRVGYGKGFYDRYLKNAPNIVKVGVSLFPPVEKISDINEYDIALDYCITPDQIHQFKKG